MGRGGPIITDSGGFQVFSLGARDAGRELKGQQGGGGDHSPCVLRVREEGVTFRSYVWVHTHAHTQRERERLLVLMDADDGVRTGTGDVCC